MSRTSISLPFHPQGARTSPSSPKGTSISPSSPEGAEACNQELNPLESEPGRPSSPEGAKVCSQGRQPLESAPQRASSPEGAAERPTGAGAIPFGVHATPTRRRASTLPRTCCAAALLLALTAGCAMKKDLTAAQLEADENKLQVQAAQEKATRSQAELERITV
jgi:hypothetical protein